MIHGKAHRERIHHSLAPCPLRDRIIGNRIKHKKKQLRTASFDFLSQFHCRRFRAPNLPLPFAVYPRTWSLYLLSSVIYFRAISLKEESFRER